MTAYLMDNAHFQTLPSKLLAHAADNLHYGQPAPYNQKCIDTLHLDPAAYLAITSIADVCNHFRQHYAAINNPGSTYDPEPQDDTDPYRCGPKWR